MFYQAYLRHKSLRDVLNRQFEKAMARENASISIHDIIVRPKDSGYFGEAKAHRNFYKQEPIERLIDHIELLAQLANLYHEKNYCEQLADGRFQLKITHLNTITRLATHEFFFCGAKPLRLSEFERVIQRVEEIASKCHDNLHLLLSSFSVVNDRDELLNAVLYVQCGKEVTMNIYCKINSTVKDVSYPGNAITSYQNFNEDQASAYVSQEAIENKQGTAISRYDPRLVSNNGLFEIETRGGARYIQAIDICLDHLTHHAKRLLLNQLSPDIAHERFLPEQVDHVVTSNTVELVEAAKTTASVLHVDAYYVLPNEREHDYNFLIQDSDFAPIQSQSQYPLRITIRGNRLRVINPPFGSEYKLESYAPRKLGEFIPDIAQSIQLINQSTYRRQMDMLLRMNDPHLAKK